MKISLRFTHLPPLVLAAVFSALGWLGCGGEGRSPTIVEVGTSAITRAQFQRKLSADVAAYAKSRRAPSKAFFDPPAFRVCAADERRSSHHATPEALRRRCAHRYKSFKLQTLDGMIEAEWIRQAAVRQHVDTGGASGDVVLATLEDRALRREPHATQAEIARYYRAHTDYLKQPERRTTIVIATDTEARAIAAKRHILRGASWKETAERYAVTKSVSRIADQAPTEFSGHLRHTIFTARRGAVVGPIEDYSGWSIVSVVRVRPSFQMSLEQSAPFIRDFLEVNKDRYRHYEFQARFKTVSRNGTRCVGALIAPNCNNGPRVATNRPVSHEDQLQRPVLPVVAQSDS
jgi:hypothetical protein